MINEFDKVIIDMKTVGIFSSYFGWMFVHFMHVIYHKHVEVRPLLFMWNIPRKYIMYQGEISVNTGFNCPNSNQVWSLMKFGDCRQLPKLCTPTVRKTSPYRLAFDNEDSVADNFASDHDIKICSSHRTRRKAKLVVYVLL